jgi:hypothetical protein
MRQYWSGSAGQALVRLGSPDLHQSISDLWISRKGAYMARIKKGALCVETAGERHYICVPVGRAKDLHAYLRSNKVRSAPPEPSFTGFDCIQLANDNDVNGVQELLNVWK